MSYFIRIAVLTVKSHKEIFLALWLVSSSASCDSDCDWDSGCHLPKNLAILDGMQMESFILFPQIEIFPGKQDFLKGRPNS